MAREENLLILKMLQDGTITAEQAAELLSAMDTSETRAPAPVPPPPAPLSPAPPPEPKAELDEDDVDLGEGGETFARARAKIAQAREKVAGVQERLAAAQDRLGKVEGAPNAWEAVADALKDVPGARSISDALRGVDPGRIAANARRQARRVARSVRSSLGDIHLDIHLPFGGTGENRGEPALTATREANAPVAPGQTLRIRNPLGDIEAVGADVPEARVAGKLRVWAAGEAAAQTIAEQVTLGVEPGADGPTITVVYPGPLRNVVCDLKVFVPHGVKASLLSTVGDVSCRDLRGGVALATQSGDAFAREVAGDVAAESASGDIVIEGVVGAVTVSSASGKASLLRVSGQTLKAGTQSGDVVLGQVTSAATEIETVSGDVEARTVGGRVLRVRTVSGDVQASDVAGSDETHLDTVSGFLSLAPRGPLMGGAVTLASVSGDIELHLPPRTEAALQIRTRSGDVQATFRTAQGPKTIEASGMNTFLETVGAGAGCQITVSTVSGDVAVDHEEA